MRRARPPYPDIDTAQTLAGGTLFRLRQPQLPALPDFGVSDTESGSRQRAFQDAPIGEPGIDVDVRSVYDVRPVNAFDVNLQQVSPNQFTYGGTATPQVGEILAPVPLGYVFVCRQLDHYLFPEPGVTSRGQVLMSLTKNGAEVPYNVNVAVGTASQGLFRTFTIYDEGEVFGARVVVNLPGGSPSGSSFLGVNFYGNFLRKSGRSANQTIGNPVGSSRYRQDRG
jgi:hypothetical protein